MYWNPMDHKTLAMHTMPDFKRNHKHYITLFQKDRDLPLQSMMKADN